MPSPLKSMHRDRSYGIFFFIQYSFQSFSQNLGCMVDFEKSLLWRASEVATRYKWCIYVFHFWITNDLKSTFFRLSRNRNVKFLFCILQNTELSMLHFLSVFFHTSLKDFRTTRQTYFIKGKKKIKTVSTDSNPIEILNTFIYLLSSWRGEFAPSSTEQIRNAMVKATASLETVGLVRTFKAKRCPMKI